MDHFIAELTEKLEQGDPDAIQCFIDALNAGKAAHGAPGKSDAPGIGHNNPPEAINESPPTVSIDKPAAQSIPEFAEDNRISRSMLYLQIKLGNLRVMKVGRRSLITAAAAAEWRALCEAPK